MIAFGRHGDACRALQLHEEMRVEGTTPTNVTFLSLVHACSHAGLVEKGMELIESMIKVHHTTPRSEHYAYVLDMLNRAGFFKETTTDQESYLLLSILIKHLDHRNIAKQPILQINIVQITSQLVENVEQQVSVAIVGAISDLIKQ
ncbi:hypothetical protein K1719_022264 [Acacia pycnantha]|nr:hypothetical protein K1719_022264 [Acacia pycnantha]